MELQYFHATSKDGLEVVLAEHNEDKALEHARKLLDRWEIAILPATKEHAMMFQATLHRSVSIH